MSGAELACLMAARTILGLASSAETAQRKQVMSRGLRIVTRNSYRRSSQAVSVDGGEYSRVVFYQR